jgi:hypothetical protein
MFRKGLVVAAFCLMPAMAMAQGARGPFELTLSGTGTNGVNFNAFTAGGSGSLGYFLTDNIEAGVRERVSYTDLNGPTAWFADTRLAVDFNFPLGDQGQFMPFFGGSVGYLVGEHVRDQWSAGPEAGIKYFVNNATFIYASMEYDCYFDQSHHGNSFNNGTFNYALGIGFRF